MPKSVALFAALAASLALTAPAVAANGVTSDGAQMHAGPGTEYPQVMRLAPNLKIEIHGCARAWDWCDVEWRGNRGWVSAAALDYQLDRTLLPVSNYGPRVNLPQVEFDLAKYWDTYYRQRPWYAERQTWTLRAQERPASYLAEAN
jgi:uncharacterized protein YraI